MPDSPHAAAFLAALMAKAAGDDDHAAEIADLATDEEHLAALVEQVQGGEGDDPPSVKKSAGWSEEKHPRDHGRFSSKPGGETNGVGKNKNTGMKSHYPVDATAADAFWRTGHADAFRIQDARYPLPEKSKSTWAGDDGGTMPGVSGLANFINAVEDILFGRNESVTGDNYSSNVRDADGEPCIVVMVGRSSDAPGAEVVVKKPKIAAVFTEAELEEAFRGAVVQSVLDENDGDVMADVHNLTPAELSAKYDFDTEEQEQIVGAMFDLLRRKHSAGEPD